MTTPVTAMVTGYRRTEDLIKTPIDQVAAVTGIEMSDLAKLRQRAMSWLAEVSTN